MTIFKGSIPVENFFYMFYYASQVEDVELPDLPNLGKVSTEDFDDIRDLFAAMLGEHLSKQLKRGLYREYIERTEDLPTIRGKIDMVGTIRNKIARRRLLSCEHDELSENTLSNQIIKTTAMLLLREGADVVKPERKNVLRREMQYFSNVDEIRNPTTIRWSQVRFHRNNLGYRNLILICRLILRNLLLTTKDGKHVLRTFVDEKDEDKYMAGIYEKFVLGYYSSRFSGKLKVDGDKYKTGRIRWELTGETAHGRNLLPKMRTDIMLSYPKDAPFSKILIIDTKWYKDILVQTDKAEQKAHSEVEEELETSEHRDKTENTNNKGKKDGKVRPGHLYQVFAYVKNKEAELTKKENERLEKARERENVRSPAKRSHEVRGMLLYARTYRVGKDGKLGDPTTKGPEEDPYNVGGPYNMNGNEISVRALDLTEDLDGIKRQLDNIAEEAFPEIFSQAEQQG